jgi:hypothetical protein
MQSAPCRFLCEKNLAAIFAVYVEKAAHIDFAAILFELSRSVLQMVY